jgi:urea transporter
MSTILVMNELLSVVLFATCFQRAVKTNKQTKLKVLFSFWLLAVASMVSIAAPVFSEWRPTWVHLVIVGAIVSVQLAMTPHWLKSQPASVLKV